MRSTMPVGRIIALEGIKEQRSYFHVILVSIVSSPSPINANHHFQLKDYNTVARLGSSALLTCFVLVICKLSKRCFRRKPYGVAVALAFDVLSDAATLSVFALSSKLQSEWFFRWAPVCPKSPSLTAVAPATSRICVRASWLSTGVCCLPVYWFFLTSSPNSITSRDLFPIVDFLKESVPGNFCLNILKCLVLLTSPSAIKVW